MMNFKREKSDMKQKQDSTENEKQKDAEEKVPKIKNTTFVIGIGGTGTSCIAQIKKNLFQRLQSDSSQSTAYPIFIDDSEDTTDKGTSQK